MLRVGNANGPNIVATSSEVSLLEGLQSRHRLRTLLKKRLSYVPANTPLANIFKDTSALQSCSAVNFVEGEHFPEGATSWRDLKRDSRDLLQSIVNGSAHLSRAKPGDQEMPRCETRVVIETLVTPTFITPPAPAPGMPLPDMPAAPVLAPVRERVYRVTGYRVWNLTACVNDFFQEYLRNRNEVAKGKKKRQRKEDKEPKKKASKRRRTDEGSIDSEEQSSVAVEVVAVDNTNLFSPLAIGLEASFQDAKTLQKKIQAVRSKEEIRRASAKTGRNKNAAAISPESQPLVLQNVDVGSMMPFHFANTTSMEEFHWRGVVKYARPNHYAFTDMPEAQLTKGQIIDRRRHLVYSAQDEFDRSVSYLDRRHVLNPDVIFSKENAMVYHTRDQVDGKRRVCSRQTNLGNYIQGVPAGYESPEDDDFEPEPPSQGDDDDDDSDDDRGTMNLLMQQLNADRIANGSQRSFHEKLTDLLSKNIRDTTNIHFPFPALAKVLNRSTASPDVIAMLELLFPIGHVLKPEELQTGQMLLRTHDRTEMAAHTSALVEYEEMLNTDNRHRHPNAPTIGVFSALNMELSASEHQVDLQSALQMKHMVVSQLSAEKTEQVVDAQEHVVRSAIRREGERVRTDPYQALFGKMSEGESHSENMSISDFLPFAFVFRRDRMNIIRESVENHLRAQFYRDMESLEPEEKSRAEQRLRTKTEKMVRQIADKEVDDVPVYFLERDDILRLRLANQVAMGVAKFEMAERVRALKAEAPPDLDEKLMQTRNLYQASLMSARCKAADELLEKLRSSNNIADSLKSPDFRTWFSKNCNPAMMTSLGADQPVLSHEATPFNSFIQMLTDCALSDLGIRASGLHLFITTMASALDSQTWAFARLEPALGVVVNGATASGKSKNARSVQLVMPPGIVRNMSNFSAQAFTTATNSDNIFVIQEEGKASLLAPSDDDRKRGGSEIINLIKDLLTRFESRAVRATPDKETGIVNSVTSISSAHFCMMLLSNLNLSLMDGPLARRFYLYIMATLQGEASIQPEQFEQLDMFRDDYATRDNLRRLQITFGMYTTLRTLIKGGAIPSPDRTHANIIIVAVLRELGLDTSSTDLHRFIQFAENYQLYYAAHMICWSPYQAYYHSSEDSAPRWTGQSIIEVGLPFSVAISTQAVVLSLTALEFTVIPKYLDSFLRDLVDLLHMAQPERRLYRRSETADRNLPAFDVNYVTLEGSSIASIIEMVAGRNGMYKLRATDMQPLLDKLNAKLYPGKSFRADSYRSDNETPLLIGEDPSSEILSYRPFEYEYVLSGRNKKKVHVLAVSLHFLKAHFKKEVLDPTLWKNMHELPLAFTESTFTEQDAENIGRVNPNDSPMTRAIHNVLSSNVFLKAPVEPSRGFPVETYDFITAYAPRPVKLRVDVPTGRNATRPVEFRRGFDGVLMQMRIPRDATRFPVVREDEHVPAPTVMETNRLRREAEFRTQRAKDGSAEMDENEEDAVYDDDYTNACRNKQAYTSAINDGDFVVQSMGLKKVGYVTPTCFLKFFGYTDEEIKSFYEGDVRIPEAVALGFSPFAYLLERKICRQKKYAVGTVVAPRDNIYDQLKRAMAAYRYKLTPHSLQTAQDKSRVTDIGDVARDMLMGRVSFGGADEDKVKDLEIMKEFMQKLEREDAGPRLNPNPNPHPNPNLNPPADAMDIDD